MNLSRFKKYIFQLEKILSIFAKIYLGFLTAFYIAYVAYGSFLILSSGPHTFDIDFLRCTPLIALHIVTLIAAFDILIGTNLKRNQPQKGDKE